VLARGIRRRRGRAHAVWPAVGTVGGRERRSPGRVTLLRAIRGSAHFSGTGSAQLHYPKGSGAGGRAGSGPTAGNGLPTVLVRWRGRSRRSHRPGCTSGATSWRASRRAACWRRPLQPREARHREQEGRKLPSTLERTGVHRSRPGRPRGSPGALTPRQGGEQSGPPLRRKAWHAGDRLCR
jgi:hypothetical protein